nr:integrase, catalytic region, zinc finger, CCHC-type, peptidase aspartic, catalytic [Tanacetum cinerariifolium]
ALHLGTERNRVVAGLTPEEKERYKADTRATNILLQGLPKDICILINHYTDANDIWDNVKMLLEGYEITKDEHESQLYDELNTSTRTKEKLFTNTMSEFKETMHEEQLQLEMRKFRTELAMQIMVKQGLLSVITEKMMLMQAQENGVVLDEEQLLFIVADKCDAFDSDVDEAPTAQTMLMANLSSADPIYDKASPSYDSDILSEYVKNNTEPVLQSNISFMPNDALMMIINDMHE